MNSVLFSHRFWKTIKLCSVESIDRMTDDFCLHSGFGEQCHFISCVMRMIFHCYTFFARVFRIRGSMLKINCEKFCPESTPFCMVFFKKIGKKPMLLLLKQNSKCIEKKTFIVPTTISEQLSS